MNRYAFALFALLAAPVIASPEMDEFCVSQGKLAAAIMDARQSGLSIEKALSIAAEIEPPADELARGLVLDAYEHPRWTTADVREITIREFGDRVTLTCIISAIEAEESQ
jgi:hypothetical protein